ncbi:MAG: UTP--glucose-1-phosphate uridylyltransferase [Puniceicoccales bacterium]|jgi:UDP-N-acetylglucosamine/UDP-N-acetylgalactosamine diphosphorylase|nr:UTP--glucose-1-phosphate uridylyltransferase [Puniceicoccales bacterium]
MNIIEHELLEKFKHYGQAQIFKFIDELDEVSKDKLFRQANAINLQKVADRVRTLPSIDKKHFSMYLREISNHIDFIGLPNNEIDNRRWKDAHRIGENAIRDGRVAILTAAGGQGTRLGHEGPKGILAVTPVKKKTLFQVFAEKIRFAEIKYGQKFHWFVMTSTRNHDEILKFFDQNESFGLEHVHFFIQGIEPAIDFSGKIMLEDKHSIAMHPDGHGGVFNAFVSSGLFEILEKNDIDIISYFQVDNPLVRCIDPYFIGFHINQQSEMSCRMIHKAYPEEKVGVFCTMYGKTAVIEYSDLSMNFIHEMDTLGRLKFRYANAAIHIFARDFVRSLGEDNALRQLDVHAAKKKIPTIDVNGKPIDPESANGIKFETFIFDALQFTENSLVLEVNRRENFSPIKNLKGIDSLQTCRNDQIRLFTRWLLSAGAEIPVDASGLPPFDIEISPLFAENEGDFLLKWNELKSKPAICAGSYVS